MHFSRFGKEGKGKEHQRKSNGKGGKLRKRERRKGGWMLVRNFNWKEKKGRGVESSKVEGKNG